MGLWSEGMNPGTLAANSVSLANNFLSKPYRFKAKWNTEKNRINPYGYKAREEFRYVRTKRSKHEKQESVKDDKNKNDGKGVKTFITVKLVYVME